MIKSDFKDSLFINKIGKEGLMNEPSNWFPLSNIKEREEIVLARKWVKKNLKKQNDFNFKLNSELIFTIFQKDKNCKEFNIGIFLYALFQDNYLFKQEGKKNKLFFNICFKDKKLNKIIEDNFKDEI